MNLFFFNLSLLACTWQAFISALIQMGIVSNVTALYSLSLM